METKADLSWIFAGAIASDDDADLVVDLSEVEFMDASTIGVILRARRFLQHRSRSLSLRAPTNSACRVLDACGLGELIESDPRRSSQDAGALSSWVVVPAIEQADAEAEESASAEAAPTNVPVGIQGP